MYIIIVCRVGGCVSSVPYGNYDDAWGYYNAVKKERPIWVEMRYGDEYTDHGTNTVAYYRRED
ncbi:MAG: hypothetical protein AMXMBFR16_11570 [Candidatus Uhrbacteria bacterium]